MNVPRQERIGDAVHTAVHVIHVLVLDRPHEDAMGRARYSCGEDLCVPNGCSRRYAVCHAAWQRDSHGAAVPLLSIPQEHLRAPVTALRAMPVRRSTPTTSVILSFATS
jgi:hypothetical protein